MALFNLIAEKNTNINWATVHEKIYNGKQYEYISFFPIPKELSLPSTGIGITANIKFKENVKVAKMELLYLLDILWRFDFDIYELYEGKNLNKDNFIASLSYL